MRRFVVTVAGWGPEIFEAASAAGARAKAYRALCAAGSGLSFRDFLGRVSVRPEQRVH